MSREFIEKLEKVYDIHSLHNDFANLANGFRCIAERLGKFEEAKKSGEQSRALREEGKRYLDIYHNNREHENEIENLDFDAIIENLKKGARVLAQNL